MGTFIFFGALSTLAGVLIYALYLMSREPNYKKEKIDRLTRDDVNERWW